MEDSKKRPLEENDPIAIAKRQALERARSIAARLSQNVGGAAGGSSSYSSDTASTSGRQNFPPMGGRFEKKVFIPQNNNTGINYVGLIIGPKARTLRELQMKTGCNLQIRGRGLAKSGYDQNGLEEDQHVYISGTSQELVDKAEALISEYLTNPEKAMELKRSQMPELEMQSRSRGYNDGIMSGGMGRMTKIVNVPNDLAGAVIGRGGEQIKQFIAQSGAHIQIDNSPENKAKPLRDLTVQGTPDQIAKAEELINDFVARKQQSDSTNFNAALNFPVKIRLEVPDNKVGLIIGKQGKTIARIQQTFRCKIDIPLSHDEGNPEVRTLTVGAHTEQELEGAKNDVFSIITYGMPSSTPPTSSYNNMGAMNALNNPAQTGYGYGYASHGQTPQSQQAYYGGYQQAQQPRQASVAQGGQNGQTSVSIRVAEENISLLTQKVDEIQSRTSCRIQIPQTSDPASNPPTRTIVITGPTAQHQSAIQEVNSAIAAKTEGDSGTGKKNGEAKQDQKYTKDQWRQWREYYLQQGQQDIGEDAPPELRADNYDG